MEPTELEPALKNDEPARAQAIVRSSVAALDVSQFSFPLFFRLFFLAQGVVLHGSPTDVIWDDSEPRLLKTRSEFNHAVVLRIYIIQTAPILLDSITIPYCIKSPLMEVMQYGRFECTCRVLVSVLTDVAQIDPCQLHHEVSRL